MKVCYRCKIEKEYSYFSKDKSRKDGYNNECKECAKSYAKKYRRKNKSYFKKWREDNSDKIKSYQYTYSKEKYRETYNKHVKNKRRKNPLFKMKTYLRNRTCAAFKFHSWRKGGSTEKLLGADYKTVHKHIESTFTDGMSWDNYGEWHIDHKIPIASATNEEELRKICHYTNLQALWAEDNIKKSNKLNIS